MAPVEAGTKAPAPDLGGRRGPLSPGPVTPAGNQLAMGGGRGNGAGVTGRSLGFSGASLWGVPGFGPGGLWGEPGGGGGGAGFQVGPGGPHPTALKAWRRRSWRRASAGLLPVFKPCSGYHLSPGNWEGEGGSAEDAEPGLRERRRAPGGAPAPPAATGAGDTPRSVPSIPGTCGLSLARHRLWSLFSLPGSVPCRATVAVTSQGTGSVPSRPGHPTARPCCHQPARRCSSRVGPRTAPEPRGHGWHGATPLSFTPRAAPVPGGTRCLPSGHRNGLRSEPFGHFGARKNTSVGPRDTATRLSSALTQRWVAPLSPAPKGNSHPSPLNPLFPPSPQKRGEPAHGLHHPVPVPRITKGAHARPPVGTLPTLGGLQIFGAPPPTALPPLQHEKNRTVCPRAESL